MKALTISEPFASLIANGDKLVENRRWYTGYRGPLAIHAGQGTQYLTRRELIDGGYPIGCVIGTAELVGCEAASSIKLYATQNYADELVPGSPYTWRQLASHEHTEGPWCFVLANVVKFATPIPAKGKQGFWEWDSDGQT